MLIFDAHLDLAMNAVQWNRDLSRPLEEVRRREEGETDKMDRGRGTVTFPEMRRAQIGLCVATQIGHSAAPNTVIPAWKSPEIAWAITQAQLAWYRAMEEKGELKQIVDLAGLKRHAQLWSSNPPADAPIGYILSLEGADSMITLNHLERAYGYGLRALGPAHYSIGRYSPGTGAEGPLTPAGRDLVKEMARLGIILDVTHLTDEAFWEALDLYDGPAVWASHNNCRSLVPHQRQFSDEQLKALFERGAVVGFVFDAWMIKPGWVRGKTTAAELNLSMKSLADHIDHVCQLAGSALHSGLGSDLDGGYGTEQTPGDLDSIADVRKMIDILADRGYPEADIRRIMHGNWLRLLERAWS